MPGQITFLTGASGSGKSLLLRALVDLQPFRGDIWLQGEAVNSMSPMAWRRQVGLLPAESHWWFDSVGAHFQTWPTEALKQLGLDYLTPEHSVADCSTGERQRLALLRLLQNSPQVVLLDEPTAALDLQSTLAVESRLSDYCREQQAALLWVSHTQEQLERLADHHYHLQDGQLEWRF
ncbi:ATP-binding cassette domain-containing protein [Ectothiorhodospiraceae bacterium BW-2]|nr:ATP-binding cassette domain-containing protein [Ectothiorhodospiraceae bacterium BW-2]